MQHVTLKCCLQIVHLVEYHLNLHFVTTFVVVYQMVFSVRRILYLPILLDACVKDWMMQWKRYTFKNLNMKNSIICYFFLWNRKKAGKEVFQKKFLFCNSYCNILLKHYLSNNSNVLYSILQQLC